MLPPRHGPTPAGPLCSALAGEVTRPEPRRPHRRQPATASRCQARATRRHGLQPAELPPSSHLSLRLAHRDASAVSDSLAVDPLPARWFASPNHRYRRIKPPLRLAQGCPCSALPLLSALAGKSPRVVQLSRTAQYLWIAMATARIFSGGCRVAPASLHLRVNAVGLRSLCCSSFSLQRTCDSTPGHWPV